MAIKYYGKIGALSTPTVSRSIQRSDNRTIDVEIVGKYSLLESVVISKGPGDDATSIVNSTEGDNFNGYRVKTIACSRSEGDVGTLRASLVYTDSKTKPYHITYTIDMQEDSRPLLAHPLFRKFSDVVKIIRMWNDTAEGRRVEWGETREEDKFFYFDSSASETDPNPYKEISDENAIKYCRAIIAGIERFNVYLPVISRTSLYLKEPPGATQDDETHKLSGRVDFSTTIGQWDYDFDFTLQGYEDNESQGWFKTKDSYSQNSDGTWQRSEEWVFSDSKTHRWIYEKVN